MEINEEGQADQAYRVWKSFDDIGLKIYDQNIIGVLGVRPGSLNGRKVCVKSLVELPRHYQEIKNIISCEHSSHVINYYCQKKDNDMHTHVVLERYEYTLNHFLELNYAALWNHGRPMRTWFNLIRDMIQGVLDMHASNLIHGALNPWRIMVTSHQVDGRETHVAKICDMEKSRYIKRKGDMLEPYLRLYFTEDSPQDYYWSAPEQINRTTAQGRTIGQGQKIDIFNLGCLIGYCALHRHLFGDAADEQRRDNIGQGKMVNEEHIPDSMPELKDLISQMTHQTKRLPIDQVECHPLFWDISKKILFFQRARVAFVLNTDAVEKLNFKRKEIVGAADASWRAIVDNYGIWRYVKKVKKSGYSDEVQELLRFIRNVTNHPEQWAGKPGTFASLDLLMEQVLSDFPLLLINAYAILRTDLKDDPDFKCFYQPSS